MTATLAERATVKVGKYEWFQRSRAGSTKYVCRVCGPGYGLISRAGRIAHVCRDVARFGLEECGERIRVRFLQRRLDRHRRRGQFYHEAPQGIAYKPVSVAAGEGYLEGGSTG